MKRAFSTLCCINYNAEQIIELAQKNNLSVELRVDDKNIDSFFGKKELFEKALKINPYDGVSRYYLTHTKEFRKKK